MTTPRLGKDEEDDEEQDEDRYAEDDLGVHAGRDPNNPMARASHGDEDERQRQREDHPEQRDHDRPAKARGKQRHAAQHEVELHRRAPPPYTDQRLANRLSIRRDTWLRQSTKAT